MALLRNDKREFGQGWLDLCVVLDLYRGRLIAWSKSIIQDRPLFLKAEVMACWRPSQSSFLIELSLPGSH